MKYGTHKVKIVPVDKDLKKEMLRQREYLERNVRCLNVSLVEALREIETAFRSNATFLNYFSG